MRRGDLKISYAEGPAGEAPPGRASMEWVRVVKKAPPLGGRLLYFFFIIMRQKCYFYYARKVLLLLLTQLRAPSDAPRGFKN